MVVLLSPGESPDMLRRQLEQRLEQALDSVGGAFVMIDEQWTFMFVNESAARNARMLRSAMEGRNVWELFPHLSTAAVGYHYRHAMETRETVHFEERSPASNRWYEGSTYAIPGGIAAQWREVTEQRVAAEALRESEERLRMIADAGLVGLFEWNPTSDSMYWSHQQRRLLGIFDETTQPSFELWASRFSSEEFARVQHKLVECQLKGTPFDDVLRITWPDGSMHLIEARATIEVSDSDGSVRVRGTCIDVTERTLAEQSLRESALLQQRHEELLVNAEILRAEVTERQRLESVRNDLLAKLVVAQEAERRRVARDLHDGLGQQLTALGLTVEALLNGNAAHDAMRAELQRVQKIAATIDTEVGRLARELRPLALDEQGLEDALRQHVSEWSRHFGIAADIHIRGMIGRLSEIVEITVYRIVQEALTNVHRHARATRASVVVERRDDVLIVIIEDDGVGASVGEPSVRLNHGVGVSVMRERASLVGGDLQLESTAGVGTTIFLRVPLGE